MNHFTDVNILWQYDLVSQQELINYIVDKLVSLCLFNTTISSGMK